MIVNFLNVPVLGYILFPSCSFLLGFMNPSTVLLVCEIGEVVLSCKERYCEGYSSHCCLSSICHTALTIGGTPRRRRPRSKSSIWLSSYTHHHGQTARIPHHKCEGCRKIAISTSTENVTDAENNYNERKRGGGYMADYNHYDDDDDNMSRGTVRSATELSADVPVRIFNFKISKLHKLRAHEPSISPCRDCG